MRQSLLILLTFNAALFVLIQIFNPAYLSDYKLAPNPDAPTYVELGRSFWINGQYSRNLEPPFKPELTWTPVFPLVAGGLDILFGVKGIFIFHILLSGACCVLMYYLALPWTGEKIANLASLIFALDPFIYIYNFKAMSEILFLFFLMLGLTLTVPVIFNKTVNRLFTRLIIGGIALSLAILTRPAGLYIPLILVASAIIWELYKRETLYKTFVYSGTLFLCGYLLVGIWMYRNYCLFGTFAVTGNDKITMVYYTAGGAWQVHHKCTLEEAQKLIEQEYRLPPVDVCHNINRFEITPQEIDAQMKACRWDALAKYPDSLIISVLTAVPKSLFAHETGLFAYLINQTWLPPGLSNLKNPVTFYNLLLKNSLLLSCFFIWSMIFQTTVVLAGVIAYFAILGKYRKEYGGVLLMLFLYTGYVFASLGLFGVDCVARYRLPLMPIIIVFAAITLTTLWEKCKTTSGNSKVKE
ncbi:MAG: hypothetical protein IKW80_05490 [Thermoguttaceae bacterium]|nr:hypothetical protein [Thermoguttaceae bacterium]